MKILTRFEGGLGDCFIANKFLFGIYEKYPDSNITIAFDTDGNLFQESVLKSLWPSKYKNSYTIDKKNKKTFIVKNNKGFDVDYPCHPDNMPLNFKDDIKNSLDFLKHDYAWLNWYNHFPIPEIIEDCNVKLPEKFILVHFYPRPDADTNLEQTYALSLIKELKKILPVVAISENNYKSWYKDVPDLVLTNLTIPQIFDVASKSSLCYAADSSIRFIPLHYGIPTFVFSKWCSKPHDIKCFNHRHAIRWLINRNSVLPIDYELFKAIKLANNVLKNKAYAIYPEFSDGLEIAIHDVYNF
jgi:hypothetical protein